MKTLPALSIYNQHRLDDETFAANFVARRTLLDHLLEQLRRLKPTEAAQHQLIVGQRGMGKTSLLRMIDVSIMQDDALSATFVPLRFREEQYNVLSLDDFWRNCVESLADWCERGSHVLSANNTLAATAKRLDDFSESDRSREPGAAVSIFQEEIDNLQRRPALLVDNLDFITDALSDTENWALRRHLQEPGGPILFGATTTHLKQTGDREAAFYEFFRPRLLEPLTQAEMMHCLRVLSDRRGELGKAVKTIMARAPQRLRTLHILTGGNPRVLVFIYRLLENTETKDAFEDLDGLLEDVTGYYKARVEEYQSLQHRALLDAIALNWDPITTRQLTEKTGIPITSIPAQLDRLKNDGVVEEVATSGARAGFQLVERFFNIWYLMRHGSRRIRHRVRWLAAFLTTFYPKKALQTMSKQPGIASDEFFSEAINVALGARVSPVMDPGAPARSSNEDPRILSLRLEAQTAPQNSLTTADALLGELEENSDPNTDELIAKILMAKGYALGQIGELTDSLAVYDTIVDRYRHREGAKLRELTAKALGNKGIRLHELADFEAAIAVYDEVIERFYPSDDEIMREEIVRALFNKSVSLGHLGRIDEEIAVCEDFIDRFAAIDSVVVRAHLAGAFMRKGNIQSDLFGLPEAAVKNYSKALDLAPSKSPLIIENWAWSLLPLGKIKDAETKMAKIINLPEPGPALLKAGIEIAKGNIGLSEAHLAEALQHDLSGTGANFTDDLYRLLRLYHQHGHGEKLITWFEESGFKERLAPIYSAFIAYVRGGKFLRDVNPEVREPAEAIYKWLTRNGSGTKDDEKQAGKKRGRGRPRKNPVR